MLDLPQEIFPVHGEHNPARIQFHQGSKCSGISPFFPRGPHEPPGTENLAHVRAEIVTDNRVIVFRHRTHHMLQVLCLALGNGLVVDAAENGNITDQLADGIFVGNELHLVIVDFVKHIRPEVHKIYRGVP